MNQDHPINYKTRLCLRKKWKSTGKFQSVWKKLSTYSVVKLTAHTQYCADVSLHCKPITVLHFFLELILYHSSRHLHWWKEIELWAILTFFEEVSHTRKRAVLPCNYRELCSSGREKQTFQWNSPVLEVPGGKSAHWDHKVETRPRMPQGKEGLVLNSMAHCSLENYTLSFRHVHRTNYRNMAKFRRCSWGEPQV